MDACSLCLLLEQRVSPSHLAHPPPCTPPPTPLASQSLKLLPAQLEPGAVARFLRCCPGLAKASIGEVLGEREPFYEEVRTAFMQTFDFTGGFWVGGGGLGLGREGAVALPSRCACVRALACSHHTLSPSGAGCIYALMCF